jgi:hypothetical protein
MLACLLFASLVALVVGDAYEHRLELTHHVSTTCHAGCHFRHMSRLATEARWFSQTLIERVDAAGHGLVSPARKQATIMLTKLAVETCVPGDVVETGTYTGGTAILIMRVLMEYDLCHRKFWAFDSFEGLPALETPDTATGQTMEAGHGLKGDFARAV